MVKANGLNRTADIGEVHAGDPRIKRIGQLMAVYKRKPDALIQILHSVQDIYGYLPLPVVRMVSRELRIAPSRVFGVVTFYHYFSLKPKGAHTCVVCMGTACYVKGAARIVERLEAKFGIKPGQTTADHRFGLQTARCLGACGLAPAVVLDADVIAKVEPEQLVPVILARLEAPGGS